MLVSGNVHFNNFQWKWISVKWVYNHKIDPGGQFHETKLSVNSPEVEQNLLSERKTRENFHLKFQEISTEWNLLWTSVSWNWPQVQYITQYTAVAAPWPLHTSHRFLSLSFSFSHILGLPSRGQKKRNSLEQKSAPMQICSPLKLGREKKIVRQSWQATKLANSDVWTTVSPTNDPR